MGTIMSFFRYPGGKSKLRQQIIKQLVKDIDLSTIQYREPFFGGGSIGLTLVKEHKSINNIWINDFDVGISCLWTAVIQHPKALKDRIMAFKPHVKYFNEFKLELLSLDRLPDNDKRLVDIGFKKLAIHQISYSGLGTKSGGPLGGVEQKSKYKIDCRWSPPYICKKLDALTAKFNTLHVHDNRCTKVDFQTMIEDDAKKALIYLDPPYYDKGNDLYQCGFAKEDHERLSVALKKTKHTWVLSYDDVPEIRKLYSWATLQELTVNYSITALKVKDADTQEEERISRQKTELLITPR